MDGWLRHWLSGFATNDPNSFLGEVGHGSGVFNGSVAGYSVLVAFMHSVLWVQSGLATR